MHANKSPLLTDIIISACLSVITIDNIIHPNKSITCCSYLFTNISTQCVYFYVTSFSWIQSWNLIVRCIHWDFYRTWVLLLEFLKECLSRQVQSFRVLSLHLKLRLYSIACSATSFRYIYWSCPLSSLVRMVSSLCHFPVAPPLFIFSLSSHTGDSGIKMKRRYS